MPDREIECEVPPLRIRVEKDAPVNPDGRYVLYWMIACRRSAWNFSLQRAAAWGQRLGKPILVLEALRCNYSWASDRLHAFAVQGMADNQRSFAPSGVRYYPYLEPQPGAGAGLFERLAADACVAVTDDWPCFFLPKLVRAARRQVNVRFESIDSNGLLPMRAAEKVFARAFDLRRFLQKELRNHIDAMPAEDPLAGAELPNSPRIDRATLDRWPEADVAAIAADPALLSSFPIDHTVEPAPLVGGERSARSQLEGFLNDRLPLYGEQRNQPQCDAASGLSPFLHWGHLSAHETFVRLAERERWNPGKMAAKPTGARGWWGMGESAEAFLDELVTWRELGFNMCSQRRDYDRYESLPNWAQQTLAEHASDKREHVYTLQQFETAQTHDPLWNAAQRQLVAEGKIHNYLRMLWGKKILHWSASPRDALRVMVHLNNKYALDGRDPNSYSGIFWVLGRYDRAWGPERPIFGKIRYMTSENTARKLKVGDYIRSYGPQRELF
ncbi:Deoxyribodipyrimidine photo-lyase [Pirellulimonas nuda]|uniref:Deoxyribodipyrimidine photo-lyase n=1 Tax=Pirellulimonas nuda TaxID=2528009 RepID=A0A518DB13_9BACT|nr:FAD-binding domain-containing protein [Pirellulimonas nuda]QDU88674.1 Deoxyribodipyrimidine photo-lyase [Pirellulimonas nuda]